MADEWDESQNHDPLSWRVRRWAAPIAMAASVAASIGAVQLLVDDGVPSAARHWNDRQPRFMLKVGRMGDHSPDDGPIPWFQVRAFQQDGPTRPVDSVRPPSPSAGEAREILAGPKGTFLVAASRKKPCESRFYRFKLTNDGHVKSIEPLIKDTIPALAAGLAMSPDGDRLAYTTAPCMSDTQQAAEPRATVTVLDIDSGHRRTWAAAAPSVIGEIVWARDNHTLGYTTGVVHQGASPGPAMGTGQPHVPAGRAVRNVTVHALDTDAQGTDLREGRVLFRQPDDSGAVAGAVMSLDGRTGYGMMTKIRPPSTIIFSFSEGEPMEVTKTIPQKPDTIMAVALGKGDEPRYACMGGIDSFGRVIGGEFMANGSSMAGCGLTYAY